MWKSAADLYFFGGLASPSFRPVLAASFSPSSPTAATVVSSPAALFLLSSTPLAASSFLRTDSAVPLVFTASAWLSLPSQVHVWACSSKASFCASP